MKSNLIIGILAHVDAGKTTLSEAMLFLSGALKRLGRVDHQDAFLDTDSLERKRGITIFSKQAQLSLEQFNVTLIDTPGHIDFSSEMEKTLSVLDYALLLINGSDGIQGHSLTLWRLLERYGIPTFIFINKMDLPQTQEAGLMAEIRKRFGDRCIWFSNKTDKHSFFEEIAVCDEKSLSNFLDKGSIDDEVIGSLISKRLLFPCFFGSALRLTGVDELLSGISQYALPLAYPENFGARVYKISRDEQGQRLSHLKVTGGTLRTRDSLSDGLNPQDSTKSKITQIRIYSGEKYQVAEEAQAGSICAVTGLINSYPGQGLGEETAEILPALQPVLTYRLLLPQGSDAFAVFKQLQDLQQEEPQLALSWEESSSEIHLQAMGEVQLEVLSVIIRERFGLEIGFDSGRVLYRETIAKTVIGLGHYEPLRHYAEVHLKLEPLARGSGLQYDSICSDDVLTRNYQNLVLTHLAQQENMGVLTASPLTDMRITLLAGRAHHKHTQGGDFHQAAYRALRQGLMQTKNLLLEPWYRFGLDLPTVSLGRAMTDFSRVSDDVIIHSNDGQTARLQGSAPVRFMRDYMKELTSYTHGQARLSCDFMGFATCSEPEKVIAAIAYNAQQDVIRSADSVFCRQGAGVLVKYDQAQNFMDIDTSEYLKNISEKKAAAEPRSVKKSSSDNLEDELKAIFERTYGPIKRRGFETVKRPDRPTPPAAESHPQSIPYDKPDYLLVDGYNIIHAWEELSLLAQDNMDAARQILMDKLSSFRGMSEREIILVFDAYRVPSGTENVSLYHNIHIVYTKEAETADAYIQKVSYEIGKKHRVAVATADGVIQLIALGHGALRISPAMLKEELELAEGQMKEIMDKTYQKASSKIIFPTEKSI